jgi:hypothetical protein
MHAAVTICVFTSLNGRFVALTALGNAALCGFVQFERAGLDNAALGLLFEELSGIAR